MVDILRPILLLSVILPGLVLCMLPVWEDLRVPKGKVIRWGLLPLLLYFAGAGALCWYLEIRVRAPMVLALVIFCAAYCRVTRLQAWKTVSIFLGSCGVYACLVGPVNVVNASLPVDGRPWLSLRAVLLFLLLGWGLLALVAYPATHAVRRMLEGDALAPAWYVFWILPSVFLTLNLFMMPVRREVLRQGRIMEAYVIISLTLLALLLLFYLLFYLMGNSLNRNAALQRRNQLLEMQRVQYEALRSSIAETRQARHDLRHHFTALSAMAGKGEWQELTDYLEAAHRTIPEGDLSFCENPAVDGVAGYYAGQFRREGIPFTCRLALPRVLAVEEMDLCVVLSNLLENALEASLRVPGPDRSVSLRAEVQGGLVVLAVENRAQGPAVIEEGRFRSSKRPGLGVGLASVKRIAEQNGGLCRIQQTGETFRVQVMLRGPGSEDP